MAGRNCKGLACLLLPLVLCAFCAAGSGDFAYFDAKDVGGPDRDRLQPASLSTRLDR